MTDKKPEIERPLELLLKIGNIDKLEVSAIIKNIKHLDSKAYINGDTLKLAFPISTALTLTTEDFANILHESTSRIIYGSIEGGLMCFKFSDNKVTLEEYLSAPEVEPEKEVTPEVKINKVKPVVKKKEE